MIRQENNRKGRMIILNLLDFYSMITATEQAGDSQDAGVNSFLLFSCNHITHHLKLMTSEDSGYASAEFWLGKYEERKSNLERHANLHFVTENLYEHIVLPEKYNLS